MRFECSFCYDFVIDWFPGDRIGKDIYEFLVLNFDQHVSRNRIELKLSLPSETVASSISVYF